MCIRSKCSPLVLHQTSHPGLANEVFKYSCFCFLFCCFTKKKVSDTVQRLYFLDLVRCGDTAYSSHCDPVHVQGIVTSAERAQQSWCGYEHYKQKGRSVWCVWRLSSTVLYLFYVPFIWELSFFLTHKYRKDIVRITIVHNLLVRGKIEHLFKKYYIIYIQLLLVYNGDEHLLENTFRVVIVEGRTQSFISINTFAWFPELFIQKLWKCTQCPERPHHNDLRCVNSSLVNAE